MDEELEEYFRLANDFDDEMSVRDYAAAAQILAQTLPRLATFMVKYRERYQHIPRELPLIMGPAIAVAALFPNPDVDACFDQLASSSELAPRIPAGRLQEIRDLSVSIGTALQELGHATRDQLRSHTKPKNGLWFTRTLTYMAKGGLVFESDGVYSFERLEEVDEEPVPAPFRDGREAVVPAVIDLSAYPPPAHPPLAGPSLTALAWRKNRSVKVEYPDSTPTLDSSTRFPANRAARTSSDQRPVTGKALTVTLRGSTWLLTSRQSVALRERIWTATILDSDGVVRRTMIFDRGFMSWTGDSTNDWIGVLSADGAIRIYRADGELLDTIPLHKNPDIAAVVLRNDAHGMYLPLIRFHYNRETRRVLLAYLDSVWCFESDGTPIWSFRVPGRPWAPNTEPNEISRAAQSLGLRSRISHREAFSYLEARGLVPVSYSRENYDERIQEHERLRAGTELLPAERLLARKLFWMSADRIQTVRFTSAGAHVSTETGLNFDVGLEGLVDRIWSSDGPFEIVMPIAGGAIGRYQYTVAKYSEATQTRTVTATTSRSSAAFSTAPSPLQDLFLTSVSVLVEK